MDMIIAGYSVERKRLGPPDASYPANGRTSQNVTPLTFYTMLIVFLII